MFLPNELKKAAQEFYEFKSRNSEKVIFTPKKESVVEDAVIEKVYQCPNCFSIYDPAFGEPEKEIAAGTSFVDLPASYCCSLCEKEKSYFKEIIKSSLGVAIS